MAQRHGHVAGASFGSGAIGACGAGGMALAWRLWRIVALTCAGSWHVALCWRNGGSWHGAVATVWLTACMCVCVCGMCVCVYVCVCWWLLRWLALAGAVAWLALAWWRVY